MENSIKQNQNRVPTSLSDEPPTSHRHNIPSNFVSKTKHVRFVGIITAELSSA
jgi:hypothetical protein